MLAKAVYEVSLENGTISIVKNYICTCVCPSRIWTWPLSEDCKKLLLGVAGYRLMTEWTPAMAIAVGKKTSLFCMLEYNCILVLQNM